MGGQGTQDAGNGGEGGAGTFFAGDPGLDGPNDPKTATGVNSGGGGGGAGRIRIETATGAVKGDGAIISPTGGLFVRGVLMGP